MNNSCVILPCYLDNKLINFENNILNIYYSSPDYNIDLGIYVDINEIRNPKNDFTVNIISKQKSIRKNIELLKGKSNMHRFEFNNDLLDIITDINYNKNIINRNSHNLILRIEPKDYKYRYVMYCYYDIYKDNNINRIKALQSKIEINDNCYFLLDIYNLNVFLDNGIINEEKYCTICKGNTVDTIFVPCRHLNICHDCSVHYNPQSKNNKSCPICREDITNFVILKN